MQQRLHTLAQHPQQVLPRKLTVEAVAPAVLFVGIDLILAACKCGNQADIVPLGIHGQKLPLDIIGIQKRQRPTHGELLDLGHDGGRIGRNGVWLLLAAVALCAEADRPGKEDAALRDGGVEVAVCKCADIRAFAVGDVKGRDDGIGHV